MDGTAEIGLKSELTCGQTTTPSPPPLAGPFFQCADWLSFGLSAVIVFAVYLFTLNPSVDLGYSGIFTTGAMYAGVPDTPGFPLWTLYAYLFTLLPFSNVAWRVSLSSAFAAAIACGFVALLVSRMSLLFLGSLKKFQRLPPHLEKRLRVISGYAAGMSFGLSTIVWSHAIIPDWWPLTFALFSGQLCLMLRWTYSRPKNRWLYAAFLLYGITLTNSQSLVAAAFGLVFFILAVDPALGRDLFAACSLVLIHVACVTRDSEYVNSDLLLYYAASAILCLVVALGAAIKTRAIFTRWRASFACLLLVGLGLVLYLYTPIASMMNPPMNWAYPRTVEGFWHLITRGQYEGLHPVSEWSRYLGQLRVYGVTVSQSYGWLYLLPVGIPFLFLHRLRSTERMWMLGLVSLFFCESLFLTALLNPSFYQGSCECHAGYFGPSFLFLAVFMGLGLALLGTRWTRRQISSGDVPTGL